MGQGHKVNQGCCTNPPLTLSNDLKRVIYIKSSRKFSPAQMFLRELLPSVDIVSEYWIFYRWLPTYRFLIHTQNIGGNMLNVGYFTRPSTLNFFLEILSIICRKGGRKNSWLLRGQKKQTCTQNWGVPKMYNAVIFFYKKKMSGYTE